MSTGMPAAPRPASPHPVRVPGQAPVTVLAWCWNWTR